MSAKTKSTRKAKPAARSAKAAKPAKEAKETAPPCRRSSAELHFTETTIIRGEAVEPGERGCHPARRTRSPVTTRRTADPQAEAFFDLLTATFAPPAPPHGRAVVTNFPWPSLSVRVCHLTTR